MVNIDATTPQLKVVKNLLDAYFDSLDISKAEPLLSNHFKFQTFPENIELPEEGKAAHVQRYGGILAAFTKAEVTIHEVIEAPGKVVLHGTAVASIADGTTFDYSCICIISLAEEDGELKVVGYKDFCDPQKRSTLLAWIANAMAKGLSAS